MNDNRVKDPLGHYAELEEKTRPAGNGFVVAGWVVLIAGLLLTSVSLLAVGLFF
jgi:hypothetical protein